MLAIDRVSICPITYSNISFKGPWALTKTKAVNTARRHHLSSIYRVPYLEAVKPMLPSMDRVCSIAQYRGPLQESQGLGRIRQEE